MPSVGLRITTLLATVLMVAVVSSCGQSSPTPAAPEAEHNAADVAFAKNMIPHHHQALDMAAMVPSRTANRDLIVIANHIAPDQQSQIYTLQELLEQWGEPAAPEHMDHDGMAMAGMVDEATMAKLATLHGPPFDELWLRSMIRHHEGAIAMAKPEITQGKNPTAVDMAKVIVDWQQMEIGRMNAMLGPAE
jgi:uncharacterized protein (DUF305 family)